MRERDEGNTVRERKRRERDYSILFNEVIEMWQPIVGCHFTCSLNIFF